MHRIGNERCGDKRYNGLMRIRLQRLSRHIQPVIDHALLGIAGLFGLALRAWKRFNDLDIPLSPLQWILLFYLAFGLAYATATPVFEAHDELWHFGFVQHLRETGELPIQIFDGRDTIFAQHGSQPPLYYALMAALTSPLNIDDVDEYRRLNPHVALNQPGSFGNKNLIIHDESHSLWRGTGLAVLVVRAAGLAMGAGVIALVYRISAYVAPQRPTVAFVAAALTGLNPMFIFVCASVNNDALSMLINAGVILLLQRLLRDGFRTRTSVAIGLLFALGCITKLTSLVLLPVLIGVALFAFYRARDRRAVFVFLLALVVSWLVIAGWWYLRNWQLYQEPFGMLTMANIAGPRGMTFSAIGLFDEFQQFRMSYWGVFGALNIQFTAVFYLLLDLALFFSAIGCAFLILQLLAISDFAYARYELTHILTLLGTVVILVAGVIYWNTLTRAANGRVLFPLIAAISPILALGLVESVWWIVFSLRPPNLEFVRAGDAVPKELLHETMLWQLRLLGIVAILAPFTVIAAQYQKPQPLTAVPDRALPVYAKYDDVALVAYERINRRYSPGDRVRVKLYWHVLEQSTRDKSVLLSLVDDKNQEIGHYASYPGAGKLQTSRWEAGAIYADEYLISIHTGASGRYPFDLQVEWADLKEAGSVLATNAEEQSIEPVLLDIGAVVSLRLQPTLSGYSVIPEDQQPNFDETIRLLQYLFDPELNELILNWQAEGTPAEDFTVFVHVLDEDGAIIAQADAAPRLPTGYWRWGESYSTYHLFDSDLPLLEHTVLIGWYVNDGVSYPKTEYRFDTEEGEEFRDAFVLPWEIHLENLRLTEEAAAAETSDAPESALAEATSIATESPPESSEFQVSPVAGKTAKARCRRLGPWDCPFRPARQH